MTAFLFFTAAGVGLCVLAVELLQDLQAPRRAENPFAVLSSRERRRRS